jgi:hypothetical protein
VFCIYTDGEVVHSFLVLEGRVNHFTIRIDTTHRITVTYMLEGRVKTITIRIDTKHCITVTYVLEGRVNHFTIRIDTKHRGDCFHSSF